MPSRSSIRVAPLARRSALSVAAGVMMAAAPALAGELAAPVVDETVFPIGMPPAMVEATEGRPPVALVWREDAAMPLPDAMSTGAITTSAVMATPPLFRFAASPLALAADRHILVGLMLLAVAAMASVSFGLWRWQVRGFHHAAEAGDAFGEGRSYAA